MFVDVVAVGVVVVVAFVITDSCCGNLCCLWLFWLLSNVQIMARPKKINIYTPPDYHTLSVN